MSETSEGALDFLRRSYAWITKVGLREIELTEGDMRNNFTDDVRMIVNNEVKAAGISGLRQRFEEMLEVTAGWECEILSPSMSTANQAAAYGQYRFVDKEGNKGLVHTCSIFTLRGGRICEIAEVAFEERPIPLKSHGIGAGAKVIEA